jgi:Tfp pilus assembly ATPase PilU
MQTMNQSVYQLYRGGQITYEEALLHSPDPADFERLLQRTPKAAGAR